MSEFQYENQVKEFIRVARKHGLRMIMVGGTAVNYYGYKRHSADVDFWLDIKKDNLKILENVLHDLGYNFSVLPDKVLKGDQNISLKLSPDLEIELITSFKPGKTFDEAFECSKIASLVNDPNISWNVISLEDLINSKSKSLRPKDILDIQELKRINPEGT